MNCQVCFENFNKTINVEICCDACNFKACHECYKNYLLANSRGPKCISCSHEWSVNELLTKMKKTFINKEYKIHRQNVLFEKELGLMPETQPYVESLIKKKKMVEKQKEIKTLIAQLENELENITLEYEEESSVHSKLIKKCTTENCRGFLNENWSCSLCNQKTCKNCFANGIDKEHQCNKDDIETAKLINNTTKPCPGCNTCIYKIDGCDQMYCTSCHTAWSWKTGKIEEGEIHNPHYFQHLRQIRGAPPARNPLDIECGREIDMFFMNDIYRLTNGSERFLETCRMVIHHRQVTLRRYQNDPNRNRNLRVKYMMKEIDEKQFKTALFKNSKEESKNAEMYSLIYTINQALTDILFRIKAYEKLENILKELRALRLYGNQCLEDISNVYGTKKYMFGKTFELC